MICVCPVLTIDLDHIWRKFPRVGSVERSMPGVVHLIFRFFHGVVYILCIVHVRITYLLHPHDLLRLRRAYLTTVPSCFPLILLLPLPFHPYIVVSHHSSTSSAMESSGSSSRSSRFKEEFDKPPASELTLNSLIRRSFYPAYVIGSRPSVMHVYEKLLGKAREFDPIYAHPELEEAFSGKSHISRSGYHLPRPIHSIGLGILPDG